MATLTITVVSGLGTSTASKTFSAADAQRILTAWQNITKNPSGTQDQFTAQVATYVANLLVQWTAQNETTTPAAPSLT